jgi:hypothetical protein
MSRTHRRLRPTGTTAGGSGGRPAREESDVKYLLMIYLNPTLFETLSQAERDAIFAGHDEFQKVLKDTGELVGFAALADPSTSKTVRVRDEEPAVTDGPYVEAKEFLAGYYVVECETAERAADLGAMIPDAKLTAIEVRPVMESSGLEM